MLQPEEFQMVTREKGKFKARKALLSLGLGEGGKAVTAQTQDAKMQKDEKEFRGGR